MLGAVEVDGVAVSSAAQRTILSALVLDLGETVTADRLVDLLWSGELPANPYASLQNHISRLRRTLGGAAAISSFSAGYRLEVPPDGLDVGIFVNRFQAACDDPTDSTAIGRAIQAWNGRPQIDVDLDDSRAAAEVARLEEMFTTLRELRAETWLASGRTGEGIAELEQLRRLHPLRERCVELLMHAYVDAGRKGDALAAYRQLRAALVEELGLDPSPALRELETAIISDERVSDPVPAPTIGAADRDPAAHDGAPVSRHRVPMPASSFVGRDGVLEELATAVGERRIITLVGPGGVGKTRLSIHLAHQVAERFDETTVVELARLRVAGELSAVVAGALGAQPRPDVDDEQRIIDAIGRRRHLLVLDNCEHVIDESAALIAVVVPQAANLVVVATSREPLGVDGEHVVRVAPLDVVGSASDLFVARARAAAGRDLRLDGARRALVETICGALDGLPLAIELAASRCGSMTLEDVAASLDEPLALSRRRGRDERHDSLRALVAWSAQELDAELADVFARTSLFAGPFTASAAAEVASMPLGSVAAGLAELADRSLLAVVPDDGPTTTYRFLETIRAFARSELEQRPEVDEIGGRHAEWVLSMAEASAAALVDSTAQQPDVDLTSHLAEIRLAHQRFTTLDDVDRAVRLAAALHFVAMLHMQSEMFTWIRDTAERFGDSGHPLAEDVLASASIGSWQSGDLVSADRFARLAVAAAQRSTSVEAGRAAAEALGDVVQFGGDNAAGLDHFERALSIARSSENELRIVVNLADAAMVAGYVGDIDRARRHIEEAKGRLADRGSPLLWAWILYAEGEALAEHDPEAALGALTSALDLAGRLGADFIVGVAGLTSTGLQVRSADPMQAVPGVIELVEHWRRGGAWVQQWITQRTVVELFLGLDDFHHAALVLGAVLDTGSATGVSGPDAQRLEEARTLLRREFPQADEILETGASMVHDDLIDTVLARLRGLSH